MARQRTSREMKAITRNESQAHVYKSLAGTSFNPMSSSFAETGRTAQRANRTSFYDVKKYSQISKKSTTLGK
jgi:hypothetical protein